MSLQYINLRWWINPTPFITKLGGLVPSVARLPSVIQFCKFNTISNSLLLLPDQMTLWMGHFMGIRILPILASRILLKKEFRGEARMVSGWADLSIPPKQNNHSSPTGVSWFDSPVNFLKKTTKARFMERLSMTTCRLPDLISIWYVTLSKTCSGIF